MKIEHRRSIFDKAERIMLMSKIISQFVTFFSYLLTDVLAYLCLIKRKGSEVFVAQNCLDRQEKKVFSS